MGTIFITMQQWIAGSLFISIAGSFIWGILSIVLSPCHLATIPLIIGFISSMDHQTTKKAFVSSLLFALGMFVSIVLIGLITLSLGRIAGDVGGWELDRNHHSGELEQCFCVNKQIETNSIAHFYLWFPSWCWFRTLYFCFHGSYSGCCF